MRLQVFMVLMLWGTAAFIPVSAQQETVEFSQADREMWKNLKRLTLPKQYETQSLPDKFDNSLNKYFPTVFMQTGWSCNQASSIGYMFTYEINALRDLSSDRNENLYEPLSVWNFLNDGLDNKGVSYFDSWAVIRSNGIPARSDYMPADHSVTQWMTGYNHYYNGMKNRVESLNAIDVGTPEGLLTLKHWLYDHLDGSPVGGLANFQIGSSPMQIPQIPADLEEGGKHIVISFSPNVGHAMAFVGWNDSVRYDVNGDGKYTNDVDINGDEVIDMRDWEIGAMLVVNSWGQGWGDQGKVWVMYRLLAEDLDHGGIWNNSVVVVKPRKTYQPLLTMKIGLRYNYRDRLKLQAGISDDLTDTVPDKILEFPAFNFHGGELPMQGTEGADSDFIEIGLDITPLLDYTGDHVPVKIFLEVLENGSDTRGTGRVEYISLYDYQSNGAEYPVQGLPVGIKTRGMTLVSTVITPAAEPLNIVTSQLPEARPGSPYLQTIQLSGGTPPYTWADPLQMYLSSDLAFDFNFEGGEKILPDGDKTYVTVDLPFGFPFYGQTYHQVSILANGGIVMGDRPALYPYVVDPRLTVFQNKGIFPFYSDLYYVFAADRVSYETDASGMTVRWKATMTEFGEFQVEFAMKMDASGGIDFYYRTVYTPEMYPWISALSEGDMIHYHRVGDNIHVVKEFSAVHLEPVHWPEGLTFTGTGTLYGQVDEPGGEWVLPFEVTDAAGLKSRKELTFKTTASGVDPEEIETPDFTVYPNPARG
ncbi:MAG: hypothetical protein J7L89_10290, partial [Bacteroidales bacterium]|nr:hypothetical protein [Bacteroidales bacterium]